MRRISSRRGTAAAQRAAAAAQAGSAAIAGAGQAGGPGTAPAEAIFARMESRMLEEFEVMERDQSGYATTNGLFSIISSMRSLPGRKSLILFSEGIAIPPAVQRLFLGVIDAREPRQREHLHHGRGGAARRKRAGRRSAIR